MIVSLCWLWLSSVEFLQSVDVGFFSLEPLHQHSSAHTHAIPDSCGLCMVLTKLNPSCLLFSAFEQCFLVELQFQLVIPRVDAFGRRSPFDSSVLCQCFVSPSQMPFLSIVEVRLPFCRCLSHQWWVTVGSLNQLGASFAVERTYNQGMLG